jgi:hypothetical protein
MTLPSLTSRLRPPCQNSHLHASVHHHYMKTHSKAYGLRICSVSLILPYPLFAAVPTHTSKNFWRWRHSGRQSGFLKSFCQLWATFGGVLYERKPLADMNVRSCFDFSYVMSRAYSIQQCMNAPMYRIIFQFQYNQKDRACAICFHTLVIVSTFLMLINRHNKC